jgi:hypothetical protein
VFGDDNEKELTGRWKNPNDERSVAIVQGIGSGMSVPVLTTDSPRIFTMVLVSYSKLLLFSGLVTWVKRCVCVDVAAF